MRRQPLAINYTAAQPVVSYMHDTTNPATKQETEISTKIYVGHTKATEKIRREGLRPVAARW